MKKMNVMAGVLFVCAMVGFSGISAAAPVILSKEAPVYLNPSTEWRSTIATDSKDQPHIVTTDGTSVHFYDKIGGTWRTDFMNSAVFGAGQFGNPHMEIAGENGWISGSMVTRGMGVVFRTSMSTAPTAISASPKIAFFPSPAPWENGNLSVDPAFPNECVVSSMGGYWGIVEYRGGSLSVVELGRMYDGDNGGEKNVFWVSKAGNYAHPSSGSHAVWHGAIGGWDRWSSSYQNSVRDESGLGPITWAAFANYPNQNWDETYVGLCSDNKEHQTAYMASDFPGQGVYLNIYNGSTGRMVFNPNGGLLGLGGGTALRYAPRLSPAKNGGVWVCWNKDGAVKVRYVGKNGVPGTEETVGAGYIGAICTDSEGNLHVAYVNGGLWYRKLTTSDNSAVSQVVTVGDVNNDNVVDLIWQSGSGAVSNMWLGFNGTSASVTNKKVSNTNQTIWTVCAAGDMDNDGIDDLIWQLPNGRVWGWLMNLDGTPKSGWSIFAGTTIWKVCGAGDVDGDGNTDIIWQLPTGQVSAWLMDGNGIRKGALSIYAKPTSWIIRGVGDISNDGKADLVWQIPSGQTYCWLMKSDGSGTLQSAFFLYTSPTIWEIKGLGDLDGDGSADLIWQLPTTGQVSVWLLNPTGTVKKTGIAVPLN